MGNVKPYFVLISYAFHTYFILCVYFGLPKGPWHPEGGWARGPGPLKVQAKYTKNIVKYEISTI